MGEEKAVKRLYIIGGAMGIGKTTVCQILKKELPKAAFLDGDWCWDMDPFQVTEETEAMVMENIVYLLNNFIRCSAYENILFCWVLHEQEIIDALMRQLNWENCQVYLISLVCSQEALCRRLRKDVEKGIRREEVIARSIARLPLYQGLKTIKIPVSDLSPRQTAERIISLEAPDDGEA